MTDKPKKEQRAGDAMPISDEERLVFALAYPSDTRDPCTLLLGFSDAAIAHMVKEGNTHTLRLKQAGVDLDLIIYREPSRQACIDVITRANGGPVKNMRLADDFGIVPKKPN